MYYKTSARQKRTTKYKLFLSANKYRLILNGLDILFLVKAYVDAGGSYFVLYNYSNNIKLLASNTKTYTITRTLRNSHKNIFWVNTLEAKYHFLDQHA